jgi:hypothetical protein
MKTRNVMALSALAALGACWMLPLAAQAQPFPQLQNTSFETIDPSDSTYPGGWNRFNNARFREIGDGQMPMAVARTGTRSIDLPTGTDFNGWSSDRPFPDGSDAFLPRNNPGYNWGLGQPPITVSGYFYIPSSDPFVGIDFSPQFLGHRAGLKLEFRRTVNNSVYVGREWLDINPNDPNITTAFPGIVVITTPEGRRGIHTNNQWLKMTRTVQQDASLYVNPGTGMVWDLPPVNPDARVSVLPIRFGPPPAVSFSSGTVFWDDIGFQFGNPCIADFNGANGVTVQDIFDFLQAWFANDPRADVNGQGGVGVQDIFDFLSAWFTGCP